MRDDGAPGFDDAADRCNGPPAPSGDAARGGSSGMNMTVMRRARSKVHPRAPAVHREGPAPLAHGLASLAFMAGSPPMTHGGRPVSTRTAVSTRISFGIPAFLLIIALATSAYASTAYGTLNNFDCVNDTGVEAHGFEIELEDVHSTDITYTYDYNHYGVPKITEDNIRPGAPEGLRSLRRHQERRRHAGLRTRRFPSGPITPTDGHQFTNPSVNFGGEHFGVGYYGDADGREVQLADRRRLGQPDPRTAGQRRHADLHLLPAGSGAAAHRSRRSVVPPPPPEPPVAASSARRRG